MLKLVQDDSDADLMQYVIDRNMISIALPAYAGRSHQIAVR
jgi:hypothetical protein